MGELVPVCQTAVNSTAASDDDGRRWQSCQLGTPVKSSPLDFYRLDAPFLLPDQQCRSTEGKIVLVRIVVILSE